MSLSTDELALPFDIDLDGFSDHLAVACYRHFLLRGKKLFVAASLGFLGHIVFESLDRHRARARGIFENEAVFETAFAQQLDGLGEIIFSFGWKSDNKIAGDADVGHEFASASNEIAVLAARITAIHQPQDSIVAMLRWNVKVSADTRAVAHRLKRFVGKIARKA